MASLAYFPKVVAGGNRIIDPRDKEYHTYSNACENTNNDDAEHITVRGSTNLAPPVRQLIVPAMTLPLILSYANIIIAITSPKHMCVCEIFMHSSDYCDLPFFALSAQQSVSIVQASNIANSGVNVAAFTTRAGIKPSAAFAVCIRSAQSIRRTIWTGVGTTQLALSHASAWIFLRDPHIFFTAEDN